MAKSVISSYIAVRDLTKKSDKLSASEMEKVFRMVQEMLQNASRLVEEEGNSVAKCDENVEKKGTNPNEMIQVGFFIVVHFCVVHLKRTL